jgi:hypothetical protein
MKGGLRHLNKSGFSKFSEVYVVDNLTFCLEMPGTMQMESAKSAHPTRRKHPKCGPILY